MSTATTLAPSATNRSVIALPMPEPVPVTNATLPSNRPVMTTLPCSIVMDDPAEPDLTLQRVVRAVSGLLSFTGQPDTPPVRLAPSVLDLTTGMWGRTQSALRQG